MEAFFSLMIALLVTILFADYIGIIKSRVFDEKSIGVEYLHRNILEKGTGLILMVLLLFFSRL